MFKTKEELNNYFNRGDKMRRTLKTLIGTALLHERLERRLRLEELSAYTQIPAVNIESLELGRRKLNWCIVAALLKQYKKKLVIRLEPQNPDEPDKLE